VWSADVPVAVVEILQPSDLSPAAERGALQFLRDVCELAGEYYRNWDLRQLRAQQTQGERLEAFSRVIHRSLDPHATAYAVANEARVLVGCDRLSVLAGWGRRPRLLAVSGADTINPRSAAAQRLESLAALAAAGEILWWAGAPGELPPQVERVVQEHVDATHVRALAVVPLRPAGAAGHDAPGGCLGTLIAESFTSAGSDAWRGALAAVAGHSSLALERALEHDAIPLLPLWRWLAARRLRNYLPKTLGVLGAVAVLGAALALVPADFDIPTSGELQPERRRDVFAPTDGVVVELAAEHGKPVAAGAPLLVLRNAQLDFELQRVRGEIDTVQQRLAATETLRVQGPLLKDEAELRAGRLTAEAEELRARLCSCEQQRAILEQQRAELTVRSPFDGQVTTWQVRELLQSRPVARGQRLLRVADLNGPWILELRLPDNRVDQVWQAERTRGQPLRVSFLLETEPSAVREGVLRQTAQMTDVDPQGGSTVRAIVALERDPTLPLRPGAGVIARIHCGRRSLGYVWLYDLWAAIRSRCW
jgi:multidrug efflux pump subunit AcrA (membrane-fusion protein)